MKYIFRSIRIHRDKEQPKMCELLHDKEKCYHQRLQTFLNGSNQKNPENVSLLRYLPPELLEKIWFEYAYYLENREIVENGLLSVLKQKFKDGLVQKHEQLVFEAVKWNQLETFKWLIETGFSLCSPNSYAHTNNFLEYARPSRYQNVHELLIASAIIETGNHEMLDYFFSKYPGVLDFDRGFLLCKAVHANNLNAVHMLYQTGQRQSRHNRVIIYFTVRYKLIDVCIKNNNIEMLLFFKPRYDDTKFNPSYLLLAAQGKNINMFKLIYTIYVVERGHSDMWSLLPKDRSFFTKEIADYICSVNPSFF